MPIIKVSNAELRKLADDRSRPHEGQRSSRPLSDGYQLVGLAGEFAFSYEFGFPVDREPRPAGDGHVDFNTPLGTIDAKSARKPYYLLGEVGKPFARIFVLAFYDDGSESAGLLGWEYGDVLYAQPVRNFSSEISSHYIPTRSLRKISDLHSMFRDAGWITPVIEEQTTADEEQRIFWPTEQVESRPLWSEKILRSMLKLNKSVKGSAVEQQSKRYEAALAWYKNQKDKEQVTKTGENNNVLG